MAIKKLSIQKQIEILEKAKKHYIDMGSCPNGMCYSINKVLVSMGFRTGSYELKPFIPSFTYTNMARLAKMKMIERPRKGNMYWWSVADLSIRPIVFDVLIAELKKQL